MSNLGTIYQINFKEGFKIKYPVVYENKSYWYCKNYGSDMLQWFSKGKPNYPNVITLVAYLREVEKYKTQNITAYVYVAPHERYNFDEFKSGYYDKIIKDRERTIRNLQGRLDQLKTEVEDKQREIDIFLPQKIGQLILEINDLKLKQRELNEIEEEGRKDE